tara:strand:+ start:147 stop:830 length:684 start_codon:yes stop_codon:yes gene_type:complete
MKSQLKKIIKEELKRTLFEDEWEDDYDAKWEAGDIITMDFDDEDENIDVDTIIDDELRHAVEALKIIDPRFDFLANKCGIKMNKPNPWAVIKEPMPRGAQEVPAWNYIENVDINDGRLEIELKPERKFDLAELPEEYENKCRSAGIDAIPLPGGRDVFPEEFWKHLEEDINAAIEEEGKRSSMTEDQDGGPSKEECDDLKGAQGTYKPESDEEMRIVAKCKKRGSKQ